MKTFSLPFLRLLCLVSLSGFATGLAQQIGTWGDQGDGTYRNPVLETNYPDNDVIRVEDTFYMMSSTNHFVPGMVILKSKDLVNWEFSNHIMPAPVDYDENFSIDRPAKLQNRGNWAGSFGYNGEDYFAYWCYNKRHIRPGGTQVIVFSKAKSMTGPWTQPKEITFKNGDPINTTDPGVFFDLKTKKAWLGLWLKHEIRLFPLSWDGERILADQTDSILVTKDPILEGEAVKLYKFGEMYYVLNIAVSFDENEKRLRKAVIQRAPSIKGPWEGKIILENGNGTDRNPAQGSILEMDDASWWFIHQLSSGSPQERYHGRPQFLEPVIWKDGWPQVGIDTDGNGVGEVVWRHKKPIQGHPVTAPATDDDFSQATLGLQWLWRYSQNMERFSLTERHGYLRLKASVPVRKSESGSLDDLPNLIGQRLMGRHDNVMTAKLDLSGMANAQEGGLHISAGDNNIIGVRQTSSGEKQLFFKRDLFGEKTPSVSTFQGPSIDQNVIWLRSRIRNGLASFEYSLDGIAYAQLGEEVRLLFSGFTPNMVGFYSMNRSETGYIDIDWFTYDYDGPKQE